MEGITWDVADNGSTLFGNTGLVRTYSSDLVMEKNGLWTGSCVFSFPAGETGLMPLLGDAHPVVAWMSAERVRLSLGPGLWRVTVEYAGVDNPQQDDKTTFYELSPGTGTEAIETHPDFKEFAGKPSDPKNGAIFRNPETGAISEDDAPGAAVFDRFSVFLAEGDPNPWGGMEQFITQNNTVWTKSWTQKNAPDVRPVQISEPSGKYPKYKGRYNWLEMPTTYTLRGGAYACVTRWMGSGPKGWNEMVYPEAFVNN